MEAQLSLGLTFLAWTSGVFLIVIGIFVVRLLCNLSKLTSNVNKSAEIIRDELAPILKNMGESAATINKIVQTTDKKVEKFNEVYEKVTGAVIKSVSKASAVSGFFLKTACKAVFSGLKGVFKSK